MDKNTELLIERVRNSLSTDCHDVCKAKCCKKGKLMINEATVLEIELNSILFNKGNMVKHDNGLSELDISMPCCPMLTQDNLCQIYLNKNRPEICHDFPLFLRHKTIIVSEFCPSTKNKEFTASIDLLREMGYKIVLQ